MAAAHYPTQQSGLTSRPEHSVLKLRKMVGATWDELSANE